MNILDTPGVERPLQGGVPQQKKNHARAKFGQGKLLAIPLTVLYPTSIAWFLCHFHHKLACMLRSSFRAVADPARGHVCLSCLTRRYGAPSTLRRFHYTPTLRSISSGDQSAVSNEDVPVKPVTQLANTDWVKKVSVWLRIVIFGCVKLTRYLLRMAFRYRHLRVSGKPVANALLIQKSRAARTPQSDLRTNQKKMSQRRTSLSAGSLR